MEQLISGMAGVAITIQPAIRSGRLDLPGYQYLLDGPDFNYTAQDLEAESIQHALAALLKRLWDCWEGFPRSVNRWAMRHHEELYWQARAMEDYTDLCDYSNAIQE